jgi:hypothetical protein
MKHPPSKTRPPIARPRTVRCVYCSCELGRAYGSTGVLCSSCTDKITLAAAQASAKQQSASPRPERGRSQPMARSREAARKPVKKRSLLEGPALFEQMQAFERRLSWIGACVPFLGPWLSQSKEVTAPMEKAQLKRLSLGATGLALTCLVALVVAAEGRSMPAEKRAEADIRVLGGIVEEFRARNGVYPDPAAWGRTLDLGDPRYVDPWGHAYLYIARNGYAIIGTFGRDAHEGGEDEDADQWQTFGPAEPTS